MKLNKVRNLTENQRDWLLFAMLFVCFPPMSINLLVERVSFIWKVVDYGYDAAQMVVALVGIAAWCRNPKRERSGWFICLAVHMLLLLAVCFFNNSVDLGQIRRMYCQIGFCFFCVEAASASIERFLRVGLAVFAAYATWGILTIFMFPGGFLFASRTHDAIYGLGAKNNSFLWFFTAFFFWIASSLESGKKLPVLMPVLLVAAIGAGWVCNSVNTMLCLGLVLALFFLARFGEKYYTRLNPMILLGVLAVVIVLLYTGTESNLLASLLGKFNRSASFSGRDALWHQAVEHFTTHPLFGAGWDITFTLRSGVVTSHAHSQWLDKLAKYGLVPALALVCTIVLTFFRATRCKNKSKPNVLACMLLIYMLHMSFDTYNYNFFTMFLITANLLLKPQQEPKQVVK